MSKLNERNEKTEKVIHLLTTSLCNRKCKYCCNNQYDLNEVPYVTDEELREAHTLCLTGGEPFAYSNPNAIAGYYKLHYPNIKKVIVYTSAVELADYLLYQNDESPLTALKYIDSLTISIKTLPDLLNYDKIVDILWQFNKFGYVYYFDNFKPFEGDMLDCYKYVKREWQEDFTPADDSIFRKI